MWLGPSESLIGWGNMALAAKGCVLTLQLSKRTLGKWFSSLLPSFPSWKWG